MQVQKRLPVQAEENVVIGVTPGRDTINTMARGRKPDKVQSKDNIDRSFLRQAVCWAEILEKPVCRRRRERNWR